MFQGKMKALTFSYDDGCTQDERLIEILDRYGLKATFNLNSNRFGKAESLIRKDKTVAFCKPRREEIPAIYKNHEIAVHTLDHPNLTRVESDAEVIRQVREDAESLSELVPYPVVGMAYPCGPFDDRVVGLIRDHTSIAYARTTLCNGSFDLQTDLLRFQPTVYHCEWEQMFALAEQFLTLDADRPQIFYIWGHSFEFDVDRTWDRMEEFCRLVSGREDIYYGTNTEILLANHTNI